VHRLRHGHRRHRRTALNERDVVRRGYDAIAERYATWRIDGNPAAALVADLDSRLAPRSNVLELGCGNGRPAAVVLADHHVYSGVDISAEQLKRARSLVPNARFIEADYTTLEIEERSLDAVVAILTLTHVPRAEHAALLARIARWLRPGGLFLASLGAADLPDEIADWLGAPMYFSHFDAATNRRLVLDAGFEIVRNEVVTMVEDGHGETSFLWILARA
jgi:SAM-dependent methyltransferase